MSGFWHKFVPYKAGFIFLFAFAGLLLTPSLSYAKFSDNAVNVTISEEIMPQGVLKSFTFAETAPSALVYEFDLQSSGVRDDYPYSGMAVYLGMAPAVKVMKNGRVHRIKPKDGKAVISDGNWSGYKGRFKAVLAQSETGVISLTPDLMSISWPAGTAPDLRIFIANPDSAATPSSAEVPDIRKLQYVHLPRWMRTLCRLVEGLYKSIQSTLGLGWGISLLLFAIVIKILLLPIALLTTRFQNHVNSHKTALEPIFDDIKKNFKGEAAHNRVMAAYKARGITPYYSLKPLLATMISLPVLIAIFNMLGEIAPLRGAGGLWIESYAYPDAIAKIQAPLPVFGNSLNILPFIMAGVTFLSAYTLKSVTASPREIKNQKRNLYLMGAAFFVIFYPFPSAMVLYWTLSTLLQFAVALYRNRA
jgi:YidC/Oxa1 family membrane protein insertase